MSVVQWGYSGPGRPENWGSLAKEYETCRGGKQQSPINITGYHTETGKISFSYGPGQGNVRYDGRFIHIDFPAGNTLRVDGRTHDLSSAHFHAPSEHHIEGMSYAAELHLVHSDAHGNPVVVAQLFERGLASDLVQTILDSLPEGEAVSVNGFGIDARIFQPRHSTHFRYVGSKTTPPCDEPVSWYVLRQPRTISSAQVSTLLQLSGGHNNRPIQPTRGRAIALVR